MRVGAIAIGLLFLLLALPSLAEQAAEPEEAPATPQVRRASRQPVEPDEREEVEDPDLVALPRPPPRRTPSHVLEPETPGAWFQPSPADRLVDLEVILLGVPDLFGIGAELHLSPWVAIESGLATFLPQDVSATFMNLESRFLRYVWLAPRGESLLGVEISGGPGLGVRWNQEPVRCSHCAGMLAKGAGLDLMLSAESVWWLRAELGLSLQVDVGYYVGTETQSIHGVEIPSSGVTRAFPTGRVSLGLSLGAP